MKKGISIAFILLGGYWVISSFTYGLWVRNGPGGGFLPLLAGLLAILFAALIFKESYQEKSGGVFNPKAMLPVVALLAIVIGSKVIGLLLSITIYQFVWLRYYEKESIKRSIIIAVVCPVIFYMVFVMWLKAPIPRGILNLV